MVQFQTSLTLTLEALGASGVVLPLEQSVCLAPCLMRGLIASRIAFSALHNLLQHCLRAPGCYSSHASFETRKGRPEVSEAMGQD